MLTSTPDRLACIVNVMPEVLRFEWRVSNYNLKHIGQRMNVGIHCICLAGLAEKLVGICQRDVRLADYVGRCQMKVAISGALGESSQFGQFSFVLFGRSR